MKNHPLESKREMKPRQKQMVLAVVAIAIAILIGFMAYPYITANQQERVQVVAAAIEIPVWSEISEDMVVMKTVFKADAPEGAASSLKDVVGKYAAGDIYAGDYLTSEKMTNTVQVSSTDISGATTKGLKVISMTLPNLASSVSGKIQPGDVVSVMSMETVTQSVSIPSEDTAVNKEKETEPNPEASATPSAVPSATEQQVAQLNELLRYVEVCALSVSTGKDAATGGSDTVESDAVPATVSLYVTDEQAKALVEIEKQGSIHLLFVARGADRLQYMSETQLVGGE